MKTTKIEWIIRVIVAIGSAVLGSLTGITGNI